FNPGPMRAEGSTSHECSRKLRLTRKREINLPHAPLEKRRELTRKRKTAKNDGCRRQAITRHQLKQSFSRWSYKSALIKVLKEGGFMGDTYISASPKATRQAGRVCRQQCYVLQHLEEQRRSAQ